MRKVEPGEVTEKDLWRPGISQFSMLNTGSQAGHCSRSKKQSSTYLTNWRVRGPV